MRLSHAIWYESPNLNGLTLNILFSPGQNRGFDSSGIAGGEPSCTGGNNPANGGALCGDGSFGDAWSISAAYVNGASLSTLAVEGHRSVNRTTDEITFGGGAPAGATGTSDEWAVKGGLQYTVASKTTLSFIVENIIRYAPDPQYNERSRMGWWLAATQKLNDSDNFNIGWGHAGKTPGDPGDPAIIDPDGTTSGSAEPNEANMYAMSIQHTFKDKKTTIYFVYAMMKNQDGAHYDLGASGHGLMTDCHDGALPAGGFSGGGGICFTGATLQAASVGLTHDF
jgi:predicted porin